MKRNANSIEKAKQFSKNPSFDKTYQDGLLNVLFNDPLFAKEFIQELTTNLSEEAKPVIFQSEYNQVLFEFLKESSKKYGTKPSQGQLMAYLEQKFDEEQVKIYSKNYERIMALEILDANFYIDDVSEYIKMVFITNHFVNMNLDWNQKGLLSTVPHLKKIASGIDNLEVGSSATRRLSSYLDDMESRTKEDIEKGYLPLGIPKLDEAMNGGLPLGCLVSFLGSNTAGKTTTMISLVGASAVKRKEKVLHIELDGKQDEARDKYLSCMTGVELKKVNKPYLLSIEEKNKIREAIGLLDEYLLIWTPKDYTKKVEKIIGKTESILKQFEAKTIIVDYIGVLQTLERTSNARETNIITHRMFRDLAIKEHVRVVTAVQANRAGQAIMQGDVIRDKMGQQVLRSTNMSESDDIGRLSAVIITINITDEEVTQNRARFYLEKNREGRKHVIQGLYTDFAISTMNTGKFFDPDVPVSVSEALDGVREAGEIPGHEKEVLAKKIKRGIAEYGTSITMAQDLELKLSDCTDEAVKKNLTEQINNTKNNIDSRRAEIMSYIPFMYSADQLKPEMLDVLKQQASDAKKDKASTKLSLEAGEIVKNLEFYHRHKK